MLNIDYVSLTCEQCRSIAEMFDNCFYYPFMGSYDSIYFDTTHAALWDLVCSKSSVCQLRAELLPCVLYHLRKFSVGFGCSEKLQFVARVIYDELRWKYPNVSRYSRAISDLFDLNRVDKSMDFYDKFFEEGVPVTTKVAETAFDLFNKQMPPMAF